MDWIHNPALGRILWLSGAAGTGKSSVANSIAQQLYSLGRLGASFRFDRDLARPETPGQLFGNLCHQLAIFDDQLRTAILSAIHRGCGGAMSLRMQARTLLVETTKSVEVVGPIVIVIDALDESGTDGSKTEPSRETLVRAIVEEFPALPAYIKVLITSREDGIIFRLMSKWTSCLHKRIDDVPHTEDDILQYIRHRMVQIRMFLPEPLNDWPGPSKELELARYADGLFIWASVACAFLESGGDDPNVQLAGLLEASDEKATAEAKLDRLFFEVLRSSLPDGDGIPANNWHYVVGALAALKTPLTYQGMDSLLGLSPKMQMGTTTLMNGRAIKLTTSFHIISSLRPILRIDANLKGVIRFLHKSVFDFLTCRPSGSIQVDLHIQNVTLAKQCLDQMNRHLRYDICGIADMSLLNSQVEGLPERVRERIPEALRYSCRHFASHLNDTLAPHPVLMDELHTFLTQHLLHWIEAMSLLNHIPEAEGSLRVLFDYLKVSSDPLPCAQLDLFFREIQVPKRWTSMRSLIMRSLC
jgi:NACHT domain